MNTGTITSVGIDVSKHKSIVAARRPGGEVVLLPFDVKHDVEGFSRLMETLHSIGGELRVVLEHTGMYWRPIALALKEAVFFVSVVNAILIHDISDNSLRKVKTDKADALKECVATLSYHAFADTFQKWCKRTGYKFSNSDAERIHTAARNAVATLPKNDHTKLLITQAANSLNAVYDSLQAIRTEMNRLAALLPEYELVMSMEGVGKVTGSQLMAEIGDVRRFLHKDALAAYAGVDAHRAPSTQRTAMFPSVVHHT